MLFDMTLDQLRVFVAVAERQHVTRAAAALNLAQSAASAAIAALEARHGAKLFHRVGRGIELTDAGATFLAEAKSVLARADAAELVLAELGGLKRGRLMVQASQTIAGYWLPRHLVAFRRAHPCIDIHLTIGNTAQVAAAVNDGSAQLGFVEGVVDDPALHIQRVALDRMVLVVAPEHPWVLAPPLTAEALASGEWVLREAGSGTRSVLEAAMRQRGAWPLQVAMELPSNEAVRAAVEAGLGVTALSASVAAAGIDAGTLRLVPVALPDREFNVLRHAERFGSRAADALLALIGTPRGAGQPVRATPG